MSPKRLVFALAVLAVSFTAPLRAEDGKSVSSIPVPAVRGPGPDEEPEPPRLVFTYPCTFAYTDGKPYPTRLPDWDCDYIHATVRGGNEYFNKTLPNLAAQESFLGVVIMKANAAHNDYINKVAELIKKTDPARLPKTLTGAGRVAKIAALSVELSTGVFEAAQPFLWPPRESESYVQKTAGSWPPSWDPYLQPIYDRSGELQGMMHASEMTLIDKASADLDKRIRTAGLMKTAAAVKAPNAGPALDTLFDGAAAAAGAAATLPNGAPGRAASRANVVNAIPIPVSDLKALPPPIPATEEARTERNYFARGVPAGLERLKNDQMVGLWHALGLTTTIGDPQKKAALVFVQQGDSCAVSSQDEALRARGDDISIEKLAREGYNKGYYVDYETTAGLPAGGETDWKVVNYLLRDHGVKYEYVLNATPQALDRAIRDSPQHDAIVSVKIKALWNDPAIPDGAQHALYVTGEEVDKSGKVRGYYVNDTGTGEAARFIPAGDFNKAWMNAMVAFPK